MKLQTLLDVHSALCERPAIQKEVTQVLIEVLNTPERDMVGIARQIYQLGPQSKVAGIKLLRDIYGLFLLEAKLLWEVGQTLSQ
jgi:ribosomal protein L7/L12